MNSDLFVFRPESNLKEYIISRNGSKKEEFTLVEIFNILKDAIKKEQLFDQANPEVVFCSPGLERSLQVKAFHVSQVKEFVLRQLIPVGKNKNESSNQLSQTKIKSQTSSKISTNVGDLQYMRRHQINKQAKFEVSEPLMRALRLVPGMNQENTIFTYKSITDALSTYILMNKDRFFDERNISLAMVKDDLLGEAFGGVRGFHRSQVVDLLLEQLKPIEHALGDLITVTVSSITTYDAKTEKEKLEDRAIPAKDLDDSWVIINLTSEMTLDNSIDETTQL